MIDQIICGSTLDVLKDMEAKSIDCVVTSPPYWGLRDYGIDGQLGLEPTFQLYIEHLQEIFDEVYRVLKKTGTCWVNIGDTYNGAKTGNTECIKNKPVVTNSFHKPTQNIPTKSLCNIPHRFAISMTDHGWIQRNCIIWHKPSCMPSSAKDRFTVDFDYVFFFVKNKKYYFEQQFEALKEESLGRYNYKINGPPGSTYPNEKREQPHAMKGNPNGRNKRAVWHVDESKLHKANDTPWNHNRAGGDGVGLRGTRNMRTTWRINPQPVKDAHFAVFPEKLVEPMIKAGCPSEICDSCGVAFSRENQITREYRENTCSSKYEDLNYNNVNTIATKKFDRSNLEGYTVKKCDCNAPTHSGIVLDPFVGSGTTALVARKLGRHYIGIDLQPDYCDMARTRLAEVL